MPPAKKATPKGTLPTKVRAIQTFTADVGGDPMVVHAGEVVATGHAVVKGRERLFEPAEPTAPVAHG